MDSLCGRNLPQSEYMVCATYRKKGKEICPSHQIRNSEIEKYLLAGIREISGYVQAHEDEFVEMITKKSRAEVDRSLRDGKRELEQSQARIHKLDEIIQRLYEDNIEGKISDERFARMSATYEAEQKGLEARTAELEAAIAEAKEARLNVDSFLSMVRRYTDITELTAEIIRSFMEKIEVKMPEKVPGTRMKKQTLVIWWNFIGVIDIPEEQAVERLLQFIESDRAI